MGRPAGHSGTGGQASGPPLVRVLVHCCGQRALWVCGLTGLAAIPVAFVLIRRTGKS